MHISDLKKWKLHVKSIFLKFLAYFLQSAIADHCANQWRAAVMTLLGWGDEHGVKTGPLLPYTNEKRKNLMQVATPLTYGVATSALSLLKT